MKEIKAYIRVHLPDQVIRALKVRDWGQPISCTPGAIADRKQHRLN
jgi:hypothetical protein